MSTGGGTGGGGIKKPQPVVSGSRVPALGPSPAGPGLAPAPPAPRGNGGGGGGGGGGGFGSNSTGQVSTKPPVPSVAAFLGNDSAYQSQVAQYRKALSDFMAQQNTQRTGYQNQYGLDAKSLAQSRQQAQQGLTDDYASRGILEGSGLYAKAYSDLSNDYDQRQSQLDTARTSFIQQLNDALTNIKAQQQTGLTQAKQDAIGRRAASIGL